MLNQFMAGSRILRVSSLGLVAGLMFGWAGMTFADGGHGGGHAGGGHAGGGHVGGGHVGGGHVGGVGHVGGSSMGHHTGSVGGMHHTGSVGGVHHTGGSVHHYGGYGGYGGYNSFGLYGLGGGYGLSGYGLGGYGLGGYGYTGLNNYRSPYGYGYSSGYGSNYAPSYTSNYVVPQYPVLRPSQYTVMPSSTIASRTVSPQSNVYSGPVSVDGQPTGDLRPGMVLPDGAIVVSVGSTAK